MRLSPLAGLFAVLFATSAARADDTAALPARIGVVPTLGVGVAKLTNTSRFPTFIGLTTLGGEVHAEAPPYGALFRFQFHSSGLDGRWTAPSFALGGSYRLFGDGVDRLAILVRGGFLWERWHATSGNCPIDFFVPTNCKAFTPPAPNGVLLNQAPVVNVTGDTLGLFAGARFEMPVALFYLALDGELGGLVDVDETTPDSVLHVRVALSVGFRDLRRKGNPMRERAPRQKRKD